MPPQSTTGADTAEPASPVLLFDDTCGLCDSALQRILRHDSRRKTLRFASLHGLFGTAMRQQHPELDLVDSMVWLEGQMPNVTIVTRSEAAIRIADYLGGAWHLAALARIIPAGLRDALYDFIARHRHQLYRQAQARRNLDPEQRNRFLD